MEIHFLVRYQLLQLVLVLVLVVEVAVELFRLFHHQVQHQELLTPKEGMEPMGQNCLEEET